MQPNMSEFNFNRFINKIYVNRTGNVIENFTQTT